jgi:putative ABC transport system substrate-binding protein
MRRREFIILLGGVAPILPHTARAQQREAVRKVAMLLPFSADDPEGLRRLEAVRQGLLKLGWRENKNLDLDVRWLGNDLEANAQVRAEELADINPR